MKKLLTLFLATMLLSGVLGVGKAQAGTLFDLNLNTLNSGWGYYDDIYMVTVGGFGVVNQSFGADYTFNDGDTFTEYAIFQELSYKKSPSGSGKFFSGLTEDGKMMFAHATSLNGYAVNVTATTFNYVFNPGSLIRIYVGDEVDDYATILDPISGALDATYLASAIKVADLYLSAGSGAGLDGFFTGGEDTGSTRVTAIMDYANTPANVWSVDALGDLTALTYPTAFILDTTNSNPKPEFYGFNVGQQFIPQGFIAKIDSAGSMEVFVPEPSTILLLGAGLLGLAAVGRRGRKS